VSRFLVRSQAFKRRVLSALVVSLGLSLLGASCVKSPALTDSLRERYALGESELSRVQLYTSDEIVLRREVTDQERSVAGHELRVRGGLRVEEVVIRARTPCAVLRSEGAFVLVGFSPDRPDLSLWFALDTKGEPPPGGRRYSLAPLANASTDPAPLKPVYAKGFLVSYGGKKYRVADGRSWSAHLLVDLDESFAQASVREEPPGWKLGDKPAALATPASPRLPVADSGDAHVRTSTSEVDGGAIP
jgi:hypothetical protein